MKKSILITIGLMLLLTPALAQPTNTYQLIHELSKHHGPYNKQLANVGLGEANFIITMYTGTRAYQSRTDNQGYARLYTGRNPHAKLTLWTTQWTLDKILNSADPQAAFNEAVKNKQVKISANVFRNRIKLKYQPPSLPSPKTLIPQLGLKLSPLMGPKTGAKQATQGVQQPPTLTQNAAGQPCGKLSYRPTPMGSLTAVNMQCGPGLTCYNGYCLRSDYIPQIPQGNTGKKKPGQICNHGGECTTGFCVKIPYSGTFGSNSPATFACSCNQYKYVTVC